MIDPLDLSKLNMKSIRDRKNKVKVSSFGIPIETNGTFAKFLDTLPAFLKADDLKEICRWWNQARKENKQIILMMGDALIKLGLSPYIMRLIDEGFLTALAMQGAGIIHDTEIAMIGETSEDVSITIGDGSFGMWKEIGEFINSAIKAGVSEGLGIGEAVGRKISQENLPYKNYSIINYAYERGIPLTAHIAYGTDTIHMHPNADGASIGKGTEIDFRKFANLVCSLEKGVVINAASAVILPEVFLKSLSIARNLGHNVHNFMAVNMDMIQHYRPIENVVKRPTSTQGRGYALTGNLEILFPLVTMCLLDIKDR